ncbi:hypothetical protein GCM10028816_49440 [Spirosoma lituiforme]
MVLSFTTADCLGQLKECSWWFTNMEFALEVLNNLSSRGKTVLHARLIDNGHHIDLPVDAFDGNTLSSPIYQLENEWKQLLR